jgi:NAD/NADP transhydrogenase alpha subunit
MMQDQGEAYLRRPESLDGANSAVSNQTRTLVARVTQLEMEAQQAREHYSRELAAFSKELAALNEQVSHLELFVGSARIPGR